ncbi:MAG: acyl-CoA dehydrogenase family protein [Actinomycetes bacterium]
MDFRLTDEQTALRDGARDLLQSECPAEVVRKRYDDINVVPAQLAKILHASDWLGMLAPESAGGLGLGVVEACLMLEEAGRTLAPVPLWSTAGLYVPMVLATADEAMRDELLRAVCNDGALGTAAVAEDDGRWLPTARSTTSDGTTVSGTKRLVPEADTANRIVVTAVGPDGPTVFVVDREHVECRYVETIDRSRALYDVTFTNAPAQRLQGADITRALDIAAVTLAAETLGAARWILDTSVAYAKVREQFGVPIGSFQAVQHKCADDLLDIERAWAATYWAAMCLDSDDADAPRAAAIAKASACDAARRTAKDGVQIHGGIGYTWEHDLHLYVRRVYAAEGLLGSAEEHRARLADLIAL